jgi:hypothetical protein
MKFIKITVNKNMMPPDIFETRDSPPNNDVGKNKSNYFRNWFNMTPSHLLPTYSESELQNANKQVSNNNSKNSNNTTIEGLHEAPPPAYETVIIR